MADIEITRNVQTIAEAHAVIAAAKALGGKVKKIEAIRFRWEDAKPVKGYRDSIMSECDVIELRRKSATIEADGVKYEMRPCPDVPGAPTTGHLLRIRFYMPSYT